MTAVDFDREKTADYEGMIVSGTRTEVTKIYRFLIGISNDAYMSNDYIPNRYIDNINRLIEKAKERILWLIFIEGGLNEA